MSILDDYAEALEMRATVKEMVDALNGKSKNNNFKWYQYHLKVIDIYNRPTQENKEYLLDECYVKIFEEAANHLIGKELATAALSLLDGRVKKYENKIRALISPLIVDLIMPFV